MISKNDIQFKVTRAQIFGTIGAIILVIVFLLYSFTTDDLFGKYLVWGFLSIICISGIYGILFGGKNKLKNLILRSGEEILYYEPDIYTLTETNGESTKTFGINAVLTNQRLFILNVNTITQVYDFLDGAKRDISLYKQNYAVPAGNIQKKINHIQMVVDSLLGVKVDTKFYFKRMDMVQDILNMWKGL